MSKDARPPLPDDFNEKEFATLSKYNDYPSDDRPFRMALCTWLEECLNYTCQPPTTSLDDLKRMNVQMAKMLEAMRPDKIKFFDDVDKTTSPGHSPAV